MKDMAFRQRSQNQPYHGVQGGSPPLTYVFQNNLPAQIVRQGELHAGPAFATYPILLSCAQIHA